MMAKLLANPWLILALIAIVGATYTGGRLQGYSYGYAASQAVIEAKRLNLQKQLFKLGNDLAEQAAELDAANTARAVTIRELEDEIRNDLGARDRRPSADSLQRLNRRWGTP